MTVDEKQMCIAAVSYVILGLVIGALGATGRVLFLAAFIYSSEKTLHMTFYLIRIAAL
jgi:hypothetical protein